MFAVTRTLPEQANTEILILVIRQRNKKPLEEFLLAFIQRPHNPSLTQEMAKLLLLLAGEAPISYGVPVRYHPHLLQTCTAVRNVEQVKQQLQDMKNYGIDLSNVLALSIQHEFSEQCVNFYEYVVDEVKNLHSKERKDLAPNIIPGTYNPQSGPAYYFTPHGNQIHRQPQYTIEQASKNYKNDPTMDEPCLKNFLVYNMEGIPTYFCGFAPSMVIVMVPHICWWWRGEKGPFPLCKNT